MHLLIVDGAGVGRRSIVGPTHPLAAALAIGGAMVVSMALLGLGWLEAWRARG